MPSHAEATYWPSTDGPSVFLADTRFQSPAYKLFLRIVRIEAAPLDWWTYRSLLDGIGIKALKALYSEDGQCV